MSVQTIKVDNRIYRFEGISEKEAQRLRTLALTDPTLQKSELNPKLSKKREVGYKPGVTDPVEITLFRAANLLGIHPIAVSSSKITDKNPSQIETVISSPPKTLIHNTTPQKTQKVPVTKLSRKKLESLSEKRSLFLNLSEMLTVQSHYKKIKREPTDLELEVFAQTWSEHCSHKTFKAKLVDEYGEEYRPLMTRIKNASKKYFKKNDVVSAFSDNAGGMSFYGNTVIIGKGETHNSPVAIDPYAGSLTKNGGVYRDIVGFGKGGENLVGFMINNFADPRTNESDLPQGVIHPKTLLLENSRGEREYGNPLGIPTHGITLHFHPNFAPKPTSLGVVIGITRSEYAKKEMPKKGDLILTLGGKTGRDGIHGATFSSGEMTANTQTLHSTAVQLGDPIVEKTMFDAIIAVRNAGLIRNITDCGAGGYSSAIGEMAQGVGVEVYLDKVPTKYEGLAPWEIFLSESQERMVLAVDPKNINKVISIASKFETQANVIGKFTGDNHLALKINDEICGHIDLEFLHKGLPQRVMRMKTSNFPSIKRNKAQNVPKVLKSKLADLNIASKEELHRMYDMTIQAKTVMVPWVGVNQDIPSEASVLAPISGKNYGVVTAYSCNPILNVTNPYYGAKWAFITAVSKFAAAGGDIGKACGIDNYIWPFPDEESLFSLHKATEGLVEMIELFHIPMVSGKDSLSSTYRDKKGEMIKAPPTLNITILGKVRDFRNTVTPDFKSKNSLICILNAKNESDLPKNFKSLKRAISDGVVLSAKAVAEGGLLVTLCIMCFGGECGATLKIDNHLFDESPGRIILEIESDRVAKEYFRSANYKIIGRTTAKKRLIIPKVLDEDLYSLKKIWQDSQKYLK